LCKKKRIRKWHFYLFRIATQGDSLWHFHVYMYYSSIWFMYFSSFYLSPFFIVVLTSLKILYSLLYREYINHICLLNYLLLPSLSNMWPLLSMPLIRRFELSFQLKNTLYGFGEISSHFCASFVISVKWGSLFK
jgi:hypothetical protein